MLVNEKMAQFAGELFEAYTELCEKYEDDFFTLFSPMALKLYTGDGLTAVFYEEGIDFYPKEDN